MAHTALLKYIDDHAEVLFDLLTGLIRIPTENDGIHADEASLARHLQGELEKLGITSALYSPADLPEALSHRDYNHSRCLAGRTNITARIPGTTGKHRLMLTAHLDTVPLGQKELWTVPPLEGLHRDGRIYGRGACDDKYALAAMVFIARAMKDLGIRLQCDLYLTGYVDEEFGGGNGALAACLAYPCDFYLNLDCTAGEIWHCAVGGQRLAICLKHPQPQHSCEAVLDGLFLCKKHIDRFGARRKAELTANPHFQGSSIPETALRYMAIGSGLNTNDKHKGLIDFAFYTDRSNADIQSELEQLFGDIRGDVAPLGLEVEEVVYRSRFFPYGFVEKTHPAIPLLSRSFREVTEKEAAIMPSTLSDLSLFLACAPQNAMSFGASRAFDAPGGAHLPDEYIECGDFLDFTKATAEFIMKWDKHYAESL